MFAGEMAHDGAGLDDLDIPIVETGRLTKLLQIQDKFDKGRELRKRIAKLPSWA